MESLEEVYNFPNFKELKAKNTICKNEDKVILRVEDSKGNQFALKQCILPFSPEEAKKYESILKIYVFL